MRTVLVALALTAGSTSAAHALCIYKGEMYAKTTIDREFADSRFVVRAKLMSADQHWSDEGESWAVYHVKVVTAFKGQPPRRLSVYTERNSGGFYLETEKGPDLSEDYLLFLTPPSGAPLPKAARGAMEVNYSCGQSKPWRAVTKRDLAELRGAGIPRRHTPRP
jgi:hypothetical protein